MELSSSDEKNKDEWSKELVAYKGCFLRFNYIFQTNFFNLLQIHNILIREILRNTILSLSFFMCVLHQMKI